MLPGFEPDIKGDALVRFVGGGFEWAAPVETPQVTICDAQLAMHNLRCTTNNAATITLKVGSYRLRDYLGRMAHRNFFSGRSIQYSIHRHEASRIALCLIWRPVKNA